MNKARNEPVAIATVLIPVIVWLAAYFGIDVSAETATAIAGAVLAVGGTVARAMVRTKRTLPNPDAVKPEAVS
jgi:hypothetical protein